MTCWSKCLSMIIAKTASRKVTFKVAKISYSVLEGQSAILTREVKGVGASIDEVRGFGRLGP